MTARPSRARRPLTVAQAAEFLGLSKMQVYRYIRMGELTAVQYPSRNGKPGGPIVIDHADADAFKERYRQEAMS